jgi:hypothetical protein
MDTARPTKRANAGGDDDDDHRQKATSQIYPSEGAEHQKSQGSKKQKGSPASSSECAKSQDTTVSARKNAQGQPSKGHNDTASGLQHGVRNVAKKARAKTTGEEEGEQDTEEDVSKEQRPKGYNDTASGLQHGVQNVAKKARAKTTGEEEEEDASKKQNVDDSEDPDGPEGLSLRRKGLDEIKEALERIPIKDRKSYMEAIERVPSLVATESNPVGFLRCEKFNASAAAQRLVEYWDARCEIFGGRAFLPMVQTGNGALSRDDMVVLKTGSVAILPNHESGRVVMYLDRSKLLDFSKGSLESRLRCMFYVLSVVSEIVKAQVDGFIMLGVVVTPRCSDPMELEVARRSTALLKDCMPVRMGANHLLICPAKSKEGDLLPTLIANTVSVVQENFVLHFDGESSIILSDMQRHGFMEADLPPTFGGTWKFTEFAEWQRKRRCYERERLPSHNSESKEITDSKKIPSLKMPPTHIMHGTEKKERKRKLNAIHSRHKRERRQTEVENLEDERRELEKESAALNQEAERLEGLITSAQHQVAICESKAQEELRATGLPFAATASPAPAATNRVNPMTTTVDVNRLVRDTLQRYTESTSTPRLTKLKDPP